MVGTLPKTAFEQGGNKTTLWKNVRVDLSKTYLKMKNRAFPCHCDTSQAGKQPGVSAAKADDGVV